ncbi:hypothetical protein C5L18_001034 [Lactobacillus amylolyticus]|nr:hypothetical protein C5L18_001034 [Lactobacillus amylolyticus]
MAQLWSTLIGYVFGNFLFAIIIGRIFLKIDPAKYGSGNPGTANMGAVFGKKWGHHDLHRRFAENRNSIVNCPLSFPG